MTTNRDPNKFGTNTEPPSPSRQYKSFTEEVKSLYIPHQVTVNNYIMIAGISLSPEWTEWTKSTKGKVKTLNSIFLK